MRLAEAEHAGLRAELAVWRAATGTPVTDRRITGPPQLAAAERRHQQRLDDAAATVLGAVGTAARCWAAVADSINPRITADGHWPDLADRLTTADRAGIDAASLLVAVAAQRPLPDDLPAAALWWRLSAHLSPAVLAGTAGSGAATLRPAWTCALEGTLKPERAQRVLADPAWPALVAAVTTGELAGWNPADLIASAVTGLGENGDPRLTAHELASALVFRIAMLTDPAPVQVSEPLPADLQQPDDLQLLAPAADPGTATTTGWGPTTGKDLGQEPPFDPDYDQSPPDSTEDDTPPEDGPRYVTPDPFAARTGHTEVDPADYLLEEHFWATAAVPRARLLELNRQAADFFTDRYRTSWVPGYLRERLGTDLTGDERFTVGYAPAGWTALTDHLRAGGATDEEIFASGLGMRARTGRVIDRFRDRVTFPIHGPDGHIHGFIARRNPDHDDAGPKYLNTPDTDLYSKGAQLFGLHEGADALAPGGTPVLVEGPLDAIAVTLAGHGTYVGVATLGTAFTDRQADQLRAHIGAGQPGIIVATDADPAGEQAAERAFWQLTARGDAPRRPPMAAGSDPADILSAGGRQALRELLDQSGSLAGHLLDSVLADAPHHPGDQPAAVRSAAEIIAPLPPDQWLPHIDRVTNALHVAAGSVHLAVLDASQTWTQDPAGQAQTRMRATDHDRRPASKEDRPLAARQPIRHTVPAKGPDRRAYAQEQPPSLNPDRGRATGPVR